MHILGYRGVETEGLLIEYATKVKDTRGTAVQPSLRPKTKPAAVTFILTSG